AGLEVGMEQDAQWSENPKHHVEAEPGRGGAEEAQPPEVLARRVEEEHQHEAAADDAERIAEGTGRGGVALGRHAPTEIQHHDEREVTDAAPADRATSFNSCWSHARARDRGRGSGTSSTAGGRWFGACGRYFGGARGRYFGRARRGRSRHLGR